MSSIEITDANGLVRLNGTNQSGGGSQPGVGDYVSADTSSSPSIPNNGTATKVTFDDGVVEGGTGDVKLAVNQQDITFASTGIYSLSAYLLFDAADPTGSRSVGLAVAGPGSVIQDVTGAEAATGNGAAAAVSWVLPITNIATTAHVNASVKGAADAVALNYAFVTVTKLAPLGV